MAFLMYFSSAYELVALWWIVGIEIDVLAIAEFFAAFFVSDCCLPTH